MFASVDVPLPDLKDYPGDGSFPGDEFKVGEAVMAQFFARNFYHAEIEAVNPGNPPTYDVLYLDGNRKKNVPASRIMPRKIEVDDQVILEFEIRVKSEVQEEDEKKEIKEFDRRHKVFLNPNLELAPTEEEEDPKIRDAIAPIIELETYDELMEHLKRERQRDIDVEARYNKHAAAWEQRNSGHTNKLDAMLDRLLSKDKEPMKHYPKWLKWRACGKVVKITDDYKYYDVKFSEHAFDIDFKETDIVEYTEEELRRQHLLTRNKKNVAVPSRKFVVKKIPVDKLEKIIIYKIEQKDQTDQEVIDLMQEICHDKATITKWSLSAVGFKDIHASYLAGHLRANSSVRDLNLYNNKIGSQGAIIIGEALRDTTTLTELNLAKNFLDDRGVEGLCVGLKTNPTLGKLKLEMNKITDVGVCAIAEALKENTKLNYLEMQEQESLLTLKGARAMGKVFDGHVLIDLDAKKWDIQLDGNVIAEVGDYSMSMSIQKGWHVCGINGTRMFPRPIRKKDSKKEEKDDEKKAREKEDSDRVARRLARAKVKIEKTVQNCADNDIPMKVVFYKETTTNKVLKYVRLNIDIIEDKELISNSTFRTFDMNQLKLVRRSYTGCIQILEQNKDGIITRWEQCRMTDVDCVIVADMMKCNTGLRQIFLNQNAITDIGAQAVSVALEMAMVLTVLSISDNKIGNTGVSHLVEALKNNRSLRRLDIIGVGLDDHGAEIVAKALLQNSTLKELAAGENDDITQKGFDHLVDGYKCDIVPKDMTIDDLDYSLFFQQRWHTITPPKHLAPFITWLGKTKGIAY